MSTLQQIFNQQSFTNADLSFLEKSIERFPYFQPLRVQYLKAIQQLKPEQFDEIWKKNTIFLTNSLYVKDELSANKSILEQYQPKVEVTKVEIQNNTLEETKPNDVKPISTTETTEIRTISEIKSSENSQLESNQSSEPNDAYYLSLKKLGMEYLYFQELDKKKEVGTQLVSEIPNEDEILNTEARQTSEIEIDTERIESIEVTVSEPKESEVNAYEESQIAENIYEKAAEEVQIEEVNFTTEKAQNTEIESEFEANDYYENLIRLGLFSMVPNEYIVSKNAHKYDEVTEPENAVSTEFEPEIPLVEQTKVVEISTETQEFHEEELPSEHINDETEEEALLDAVLDEEEVEEILVEEEKEVQLLYNPLSEGKISVNQTEKIESSETKPISTELNEVKLKSVPSDAKLSFQEWLKLSNIKPYSDSESQLPTKEKKTEIIEEFIEKNPKIRPQKSLMNEDVKEFTGIHNKEEISHLMTETLAELYVEQHKYALAIKAFQILSLKYPEKNRYFASRIEEIKKL